MRGVRRDERREAAPGLRRCSARAACTMATAPPLCAGGGPHRAARPSPPPHLPRTWHASRAASGPPSLPELLAPPKLAAAARACCRMRRRWESACRRVTSASCSAASTLALIAAGCAATADAASCSAASSPSIWARSPKSRSAAGGAAGVPGVADGAGGGLEGVPKPKKDMYTPAPMPQPLHSCSKGGSGESTNNEGNDHTGRRITLGRRARERIKEGRPQAGGSTQVPAPVSAEWWCGVCSVVFISSE